MVEWSGGASGNASPKKFAQTKRIGRPPRNCAFRVQSCEIPDQ
jgi:hypothetical protein